METLKLNRLVIVLLINITTAASGFAQDNVIAAFKES